MKIETTKKYELFHFHQWQQPMSTSHVNRLRESIQKYGYLPSRPIQVCKNGDEGYKIIDGHHRFAAAKSLGLAIPFVCESPDHEDVIGDVNYIVKKWSAGSFVSLYSQKGNKHYIKLESYVSAGIPINAAASLLSGESAHSGNINSKVRAGTFKVKTTKYADAIMDVLRACGDIVPVIKSRVFIEAISILLHVEDFDVRTLIKRAKENPRMFTKCPTRNHAIQLIDEIYNFRSRTKVDLVHLAKEAMTKRNKVGMLKKDT